MITANGCVVTLKDSAGNGSMTSARTLGQAINGGTIKIKSGTFTCTGDNSF